MQGFIPMPSKKVGLVPHLIANQNNLGGWGLEFLICSIVAFLI